MGTRQQPALDRRPWAVAAGLALLLLAVATRYGPHRDELYFIAAGARPAWGYPDQGPLTPLLARLTQEVAPGSLLALRVPSALAMALLVVVGALLARELGGDRRAQLLAALGTACGALVLAVGHLLSTATFDLLLATTALWLATRALVRDDPRWWLAAGLAVGVDLLDKHLVVVLMACLVAGVALSPATRHHLRSPWAWAGAAVAVLLWAPTLAWQAANGWPQLELTADIRAEYSATGERIGYLLFPLIAVSPLAVPLWGAGLWALARRPGWERVRPLAWTAGLAFVAHAVLAGKGYYLGPLYPVLLAAGSVVAAQRWHQHPGRLVAVGAALVVGILPGLPVALPVLPVQAWAGTPFAVLGEDQAETVGWPALADQVRATLAGLPPGAVVLTGNYGEAGAVEWYGVSERAYSGHNGFGTWGPPPDGAGPVVVLGYRAAPPVLVGCRTVGRVDNGVGVDNEEQDGLVQVCDGPAGGSWSAIWPEVVHLSA